MKKKFYLILLTVLGILSFSFLTEAKIITAGGPGTCWEQQADGSWKVRAGNDYLSDGWFNYLKQYYLLSPEGYMLKGWQNYEGQHYYLTVTATEGHPEGSLYVNCTTPDGYQVDENGALIGEFPPETIYNPYGYNCVEVNLSTQTVYVYIGPICVLSSSCVSGRNTAARATAEGHFKIYAKERDRYLKGKNEDGTEYKSWVNYWMPFNGGQGLHDASWRSSFGGNIYVNNGSHGCVNLPPSVAAQLYDISYVGMPVIVHK